MILACPISFGKASTERLVAAAEAKRLEVEAKREWGKAAIATEQLREANIKAFLAAQLALPQNHGHQACMDALGKAKRRKQEHAEKLKERIAAASTEVAALLTCSEEERHAQEKLKDELASLQRQKDDEQDAVTEDLSIIRALSAALEQKLDDIKETLRDAASSAAQQ